MITTALLTVLVLLLGVVMMLGVVIIVGICSKPNTPHTKSMKNKDRCGIVCNNPPCTNGMNVVCLCPCHPDCPIVDPNTPPRDTISDAVCPDAKGCDYRTAENALEAMDEFANKVLGLPHNTPPRESISEAKEWEKEFDELNSREMFVTGDADFDEIKAFISRVEAAAYERGKNEREADYVEIGNGLSFSFVSRSELERAARLAQIEDIIVAVQGLALSSADTQQSYRLDDCHQVHVMIRAEGVKKLLDSKRSQLTDNNQTL